MPDLHFQVDGVEVAEFAAVPTLTFGLRIENREPDFVRSVMLQTQIRIAPHQRPYSQQEQARLFELFGAPSRWGETVKGFLWMQHVALIPSFTDQVLVDLPVVCTYDFEIMSAKYFHPLEAGEVPLEFLFSGTVFYQGAKGNLQTVQIPWDKEATYRLPVRIWKQMMERYFPGSAWLRIRKDAFDRLYLYKIRHGLASWEAVFEELFRASEERVES